MKLISRLIPVIIICFIISCSGNPEITTDELLSHIKYLSSDSLKGRQTGMPGDSLAAEFIKEELASYGFVPLTGDGLQRFKVATRVMTGPENSLSADGKSFIADEDFTPMGFSSNSSLEAEVIFASYGFNINNDSLKWNDYENLNPTGKWVMILRGDPEPDNTLSSFIPFAGDRDKAMIAKDLGAAGILMVSGPEFDPKDEFETLNPGEFSAGLPVIRIKREVADAIIAKTNKTVSDLEKKLNKTRQSVSFSTGISLAAQPEIIIERNNTRNVVMLLPGEDEDLKNEYIIIGGHFDHLGMGGPGSSSRAVDTIAAHHGADDNASGIAMMLELAEKFALTKESHKRSIICVAFSGEEMGLLGSKYFAENAGIDLSKVNAMINLDMVGRYEENKPVQVYGTGTAENLRNFVTSSSDTSVIKFTLSDEGYGPSDHSSFYGKSIPVLFYTTGAHLDYHTPSDTYDKINYEGMEMLAPIIYSVAEKLANSPERLKFTESGPKIETGRALRRKGVTLGIMPDFAGNVKNGLRADFVTPGKPGAMGGMKKGDIITGINGKVVNNIQDYMFRMGQLKHGQTISIEILRDNEKTVLLIQL